ncbi:MAG: sigma-70 region 4 domain-containing protein [Actinobacteria bacterium]|nr:sigma-70 region 4 domain-containing protein [Actinomycetota bacterium]
MSGLETLPPDQRAVLQLILVQGRGYDELAATLRLDPAAVRERAHAGARALVPDAPAGDVGGRVVDYLLGQQDDGERIVTFAELGDTPAARRWAQALRERLSDVAPAELPEVPAAEPVAAAVNGSGMATAAPDPAATTAAIAAIPPAPAPTSRADAPAATPPARPPRAPRPSAPGGPRPSRLGGAILIAGVVALAIVLAIVLIGGDSGGGSPASTSAAPTTSARAPARTATTPASRAQARTVGGAVLRPASGDALGAALIQQASNGRRLLAVEAARMPGNAAQDFYGIWLQGPSGSRFLGFVPNQVRAGGSFTVSSALARDVDLKAYTSVLVTTEGSTAVPTTPGATVLSGALRLAG